MPLRDAIFATFSPLREVCAGFADGIDRVSRFETVCLTLGLGGFAMSLGVTVAQAMLPSVIDTEAALRRAVVDAGFEASICPDGWAADHAMLLSMTESEIFAWYLRESFTLTDREVITSVGLYLQNATDFRMIQGPALTRNQILLCIAESRRLTVDPVERVPPLLRGV